jgi:tRNA(Ile2) C34 agmatinyltransferase TiaS
LSDGDEEVTVDTRKRAWARLLAKVYEVDSMVCPKCGAEMKVIAVIEDPDELRRILRHPGCRAEQQPQAATRLMKIGRSPLGFDPDRLNR